MAADGDDMNLLIDPKVENTCKRKLSQNDTMQEQRVIIHNRPDKAVKESSMRFTKPFLQLEIQAK